MMSWLPSWKYEVLSEIRLHQSISFHSRNTPAKFHPARIRNDGALGFFGSGNPNKNNSKKNKMSSDIGSGSWCKNLCNCDAVVRDIKLLRSLFHHYKMSNLTVIQRNPIGFGDTVEGMPNYTGSHDLGHDPFQEYCIILRACVKGQDETMYQIGSL